MICYFHISILAWAKFVNLLGLTAVENTVRNGKHALSSSKKKIKAGCLMLKNVYIIKKTWHLTFFAKRIIQHHNASLEPFQDTSVCFFRHKLKMANKNLSQIFLKINSMRHKGKLHRETDCSLSPEKHGRIAQNWPALSRDRKLLHLPEIPLNEKEVQVGMKLSLEKQQKMLSAHLSPLTTGSM